MPFWIGNMGLRLRKGLLSNFNGFEIKFKVGEFLNGVRKRLKMYVFKEKLKLVEHF